jgi:hypothetical protein
MERARWVYWNRWHGDPLYRIQAENGFVVYYMPGYGYPQPAYNLYKTYFPGAMVGADSLLAHQPYYPGPIYQQPLTSSTYFQPPVAYGSEVSPVFSWDSGHAIADRENGNTFIGNATGGYDYKYIQEPGIPADDPTSFKCFFQTQSCQQVSSSSET